MSNRLYLRFEAKKRRFLKPNLLEIYMGLPDYRKLVLKKVHIYAQPLSENEQHFQEVRTYNSFILFFFYRQEQ